MALQKSKQLNPRLTGSFTLSGSLDITEGNLSVNQYIAHTDDANTRINFTDDSLELSIIEL